MMYFGAWNIIDILLSREFTLEAQIKLGQTHEVD